MHWLAQKMNGNSFQKAYTLNMHYSFCRDVVEFIIPQHGQGFIFTNEMETNWSLLILAGPFKAILLLQMFCHGFVTRNYKYGS